MEESLRCSMMYEEKRVKVTVRCMERDRLWREEISFGSLRMRWTKSLHVGRGAEDDKEDAGEVYVYYKATKDTTKKKCRIYRQTLCTHGKCHSASN